MDNINNIIEKFKKNFKSNVGNSRSVVKSSALCSLIGLTLVGVGMGLGGASSFYVGNDNNMLGFSRIKFVDYNNSDKNEIIVKEQDIKELYNLDAVDEIDTLIINCGSVNNIEINRGNQLALIYDSNEVTHNLQGNTLEIKNNSNYNYTGRIGIFNSLDIHYDKSNIKISIPETSNIKYIKIDAVGEVSINDLTTETLSIQSNLGDISLANTHAQNLEIDSNIASVVINSGSFNTIDFELDLGNVKLNQVDIYESAFIDADLGNINLSLKGADYDYNYYINTKMGNASINSNNIGSTSSLNNNASIDLNLNASMGNIKIFTNK